MKNFIQTLTTEPALQKLRSCKKKKFIKLFYLLFLFFQFLAKRYLETYKTEILEPEVKKEEVKSEENKENGIKIDDEVKTEIKDDNSRSKSTFFPTL